MRILVNAYFYGVPEFAVLGDTIRIGCWSFGCKFQHMRQSLLFIIALISLTQRFVIAQNLVVNGGFERQAPKVAGTWQAAPKPCQFASASDIVNSSAEGWKTFDVQTPDLLEWDSVNTCPNFPKPRKGNRMMGLIMYHPFQDGQFAFDYHELIQGTLAKPLEKGQTYRLSFWVYTNDSLGAQHLNKVYGRTTGIRPTLCGNFGFYFSDRRINTRENFMLSQLDFPVKPQVNMAEIVETKGQWRKISLAFKADRGAGQAWVDRIITCSSKTPRLHYYAPGNC